MNGLNRKNKNTTLQIRNSTAEFLIFTMQTGGEVIEVRLRDFALRGDVVDKKRMENGAFLGEDYFEHLLAEIREIRLSERLSRTRTTCDLFFCVNQPNLCYQCVTKSAIYKKLYKKFQKNLVYKINLFIFAA